ncbi:DUF885 domain-containing protein [Alteromonadaceae bacterium BrNp21-10]|nr:DUF885 domain-containing protein [Alteromonadaceae bacterium BrNp21-10]
MTSRLSLIIIPCVALMACQPVDNTPAQQSQVEKVISRADIDSVINKHTQQFLRLHPTMGTALGLDKSIAGNHQRLLPDYSQQGFTSMQATMSQAAAELAKINREGLSDQDRLHMDINQVIDLYFAGDSRFAGGYIDTWGGQIPYAVNQIWSPVITVPSTLQDQQLVTNSTDAEDYLTRLNLLATMVAQLEDKTKADADSGIVLPQKLFVKTLAFLTNFTNMNAAEHALVTSFHSKLSDVESLDEMQKNALVDRATDIVQQHIYPAYQQLHDYLSDLQQRAPEADGIWAQPGGTAFYQHQIKYMADSDLSPQQIHQIGLDEVTRITEEMNTLLNANGRSEGTVGERLAAMSADPEFLYEDSDMGRQQVLDALTQQIEKVMVIAPTLFATLPTQKVVVKRVPKVSEASAPGGYYSPPSLDGSRPGEYYINLRDMAGAAKYTLKTLTYHEAVPGHHFQIALNMAQTDIGIMRQNAPFNAYVEGWALYSELLAKEIGMYEGDPWGDLGRLQGELFRSVRLVVDTGLHYKKWTREQAIEYFYNTTGTAMSDVVSEVERYMVLPGQALGYKLGMLKFVELRDMAKSELGDKFDVKAFHDVILLPGARPMKLVEVDVNRWIESLI